MAIKKLKPTFKFNEEQIKQLRQIAPEAFKDNVLDFNTLYEALSDFLEDDNFQTENYSLMWPGKSDAKKVAASHFKGSILPKDKYVTNDSYKKNIFIEGENLAVLKLLQKSYSNKIKIITIDPPYNTGSDFIYDDDFTETVEDYLKQTGQLDEKGRKLTTNSKADGRFHSKWLSMMYPRLRLAYNLLSEDGIIFINIDDNELFNLRIIMNEIFGEENFICQFIWKSKSGGANDSRFVATDHEYVLCFCKDNNSCSINLDKNATVTTNYNKEDENGKYSLDRLDKQSLGYLKSLDFPISGPNGILYRVHHNNPNAKVARWRWSKDTVKERYNELVFKDGYVYTKNYQKEGSIPRSLLIEERFGRTRTGKTDFRALFDVAYFSAPKPVELIKYLLQIASDDDCIVLDFFGGSGTMAQAILENNCENNINNIFILIQLPEKINEKEQAYKDGYRLISEITQERIKKVIDQLKKQYPKKNGLEFKSFKLGATNFKSWQNYNGTDTKHLETLFDQHESSLVDDWKPENLLTEILLIEGFPLDSKVEVVESFKKNNLLKVISDFCEHALFICLDRKVEDETIKDLLLGDKDIFICLDNAVTDKDKARLDDKGLIKTI